MRTILYRGRYDHTNADFLMLNILKFKDIHFLSGCNFTFKSLNNLHSPINYFNFSINERYDLRNNQCKLHHPFFRSKQGQSSPSYYCCTFWNSLPISIRLSQSYSSFKFSLKRHLINSYNQ